MRTLVPWTHAGSYRARVGWPGQRRLALVVVAVVGLFALCTGLFEGNASGWTAFDDVGELLAALAGAGACAVRAARETSLHSSLRELRSRGESRESEVALQRQTAIAWWLLTAGVGLWAMGQLGWSVYEVGLHTTPPSPSWLDVLFIGFSVLVVGGLLAMVRTPAGLLSNARGLVEGLFIAAGFLLLSWILLGPVIAGDHDSTFSTVVDLSYPIADVAALSVVLFVAMRRVKEPPVGLGLLALGIMSIAVSDCAYLYLSDTTGSVPGATLLDTGWVAGFLLIALAAQRHRAARPWARRLASVKLVLALPGLPGAVGVAIAMSNWLRTGHVGLDGTLLSLLAVVFLLAVALLVLISYENRSLVDNLEGRVEERTAELRATERYYRALVRRSSDIVMVVGPDLRVRSVSDSILTVFGYPPDRFAGCGLDCLGEDAVRVLTQALERLAVAPGQSVREEWGLIDANGRERRAESTITNLLSDPHVGAFVLNIRDDTDRAALQEQLREQALHDPLTGLANRALLMDRAGQAFVRSQRKGAAVAVIVVDIDNFKLVNDRLGHLAGDRLLHEVAKRLVGAVRPEDTVARIGGDEFVVLLDPVGHTDDAMALARRLHEAMHTAFQIDGEPLTITVSIGVAVDGAPHSDFEQLLSDADVAMYVVKTGGRDAVQLFEASMHTQSREQFQMQAELREGLERAELWLLYQPEYDSEDGRLRGFEALVRWSNPKQGLIQPDRFIPIAESSGLIVPLGRWVLEEALRQMTAWDLAMGDARALSIAVNISTVQLNAPSLVNDVRRALQRSGIDPARVVLEITESALIDSSPRVVDVLNALKALGVSLAIDDFGTGYASISYLQRIPVDILKIDKTFVLGGEEDGNGRELLEAIVNIGKALALTTVAEGVERQSQLETITQIGCDLVQGYLLSKPLPPEGAQQLIASSSNKLEYSQISRAG
jgi:diguanylate cyclase (GGDEF)-like protein/PAS domain S-box-containing protein